MIPIEEVLEVLADYKEDIYKTLANKRRESAVSEEGKDFEQMLNEAMIDRGTKLIDNIGSDIIRKASGIYGKRE